MRQKQREGEKVISFDDVSWEILTEQTSKLMGELFSSSLLLWPIV
jgi:hypothetical protein